MKSPILFCGLLALTTLVACNHSEKNGNTGWEVYGGSKANNRYSPLFDIDTANVNQLQVAWTYHTGDSGALTQIQVNPLIIDTILYGVSPRLKLFALNAATGKRIWQFDPAAYAGNSKNPYYFSMNVCRGLAYYSDGKSDRRIFFGASSYLFCIDANSGQPDTSFGSGGRIDLHNDLGRDVNSFFVAATTPGIVYEDMIIIGDRVDEGAAAAPGHIRAYDVHSGKLRWIFHTIPQPGEAGYESWKDPEAYKHIGGANSWAGFSLDEEKGILFAPTGSASYDFYGGKRLGDNLFANSVLAIDAKTGKRIWHFQTVHHDVWDRDLSSAPVVVNLTKDGKKIEAVAQTTKSGFVFLFERNTGKPVYPINEVPVPTRSELPGEELSPTQPWPSLPEPFARQVLAEKDLNHLIADTSFETIRRRLAGYNTGFMFNPPSRKGTIIFPGYDGGAEWGGPAVDPSTGWLYVNANEMPWVLTMVEAGSKIPKNETNLQAGQRLYAGNCMRCHGNNREGSGNIPALIRVQDRYQRQQFLDLISTGRRMMPALSLLSESEKNAIASFILEDTPARQQKFIPPVRKEDSYFQLPYTSTGYNKFLTPEGYPAVAPPWGTLNAIDLTTGKIAWKVPLGEYAELKAKGLPATGTENYGGPVVTAGGVVFIAASRDGKFRAFHKATGRLLWETTLPAPGFATPAVYRIGGKQFVVIACGGGKLGTPSGDAYVAFALP